MNPVSSSLASNAPHPIRSFLKNKALKTTLLASHIEVREQTPLLELLASIDRHTYIHF